MRDKEIKVTIQRKLDVVIPEKYKIVRITNSAFVKTEIGEDGKRRGSLRDPELKFYAGDCLTPRQAEDIAACYESTVIAPESE